MSLLANHCPEDWIEKAGNDFRAAADLMRVRSGSLSVVCFPCQLTAEKYLKAVMVSRNMPVPKTHNLPKLLRLLQVVVPSDRDVRKEAAWLSEFAVEARYPSHSGTAVTREHAFAIAGRIKLLCRERINLNAD